MSFKKVFKFFYPLYFLFLLTSDFLLILLGFDLIHKNKVDHNMYVSFYWKHAALTAALIVIIFLVNRTYSNLIIIFLFSSFISFNIIFFLFFIDIKKHYNNNIKKYFSQYIIKIVLYLVYLIIYKKYFHYSFKTIMAQSKKKTTYVGQRRDQLESKNDED